MNPSRFSHALRVAYCITFAVAPALIGQPVEKAILARTDKAIGSNFYTPLYRLLEESVLEIPLATSSQFATYIDLRDGRRLLGDPQDTSPRRAVDFDPLADIAIVADLGGTSRSIEASSETVLANFNLSVSPAQFVIASQGRRAIAIGISFDQGVLLQAFDSRSGQESWRLLLPSGSRVELSSDRSRLNVIRADPAYPGGRFLELYDPINGARLASVDLLDSGPLSNQVNIQAYSKNGRFAFWQTSSPSTTVVIDISANSIRNLGGDLLTEISDDSRFAIVKNGSQWRAIGLETPSIALPLPAGQMTDATFSGGPEELAFYDSGSHALKFANIVSGETRVAMVLPSDILQLMILATSADGRYFALGTFDDRLHIFDTLNRSTTAIQADLGNYFAYRIDVPSERLVAIGIAGNVASVSLSSPDGFEALADEKVERLAVSADGSEISALFMRGRVRRYDGGSLELVDEHVLQKDLNDAVFAIASDAPLIAFQADGELRLSNYETQEVVWTRPIPRASEGVVKVELSASGRYLALQTFNPFDFNENRTLRVIDTSSAEIVLENEGDPQSDWQLAFAANESVVCFGTPDANSDLVLTSYRLSDGSLQSTSPSIAFVNALSVSSDGSRAFLASGSTVFAVTLSTGEASEIVTLAETVGGGIESLSMNPEETRALVTDLENMVYLIDLQSGEALASASTGWERGRFLAHLADSNSFLFSSNNSAFGRWKILDTSRRIAIAASAPQGQPVVEVEVAKEKGYRFFESEDLLQWEKSDPFNGGVAPADAIFSKPLLPSSQTFLQVWEYE